MNFTITDISLPLHQRLRDAAQAAGRDLNTLILSLLETFAPEQPPTDTERAALLQRIRERRDSMSICLTEEMIEDAINEGRKYCSQYTIYSR